MCNIFVTLDYFNINYIYRINIIFYNIILYTFYPFSAD